jgi:Raf kinase inhibitor-like YbhB/YbcL family protein
MSMRLTSSAFSARDKIPTRFTCDGADISPPLAWSDAPQGTRSFALVCSDPDAPNGVWFHWAIFDIPGGTNHLAEHHAKDGPSPRQARNDFGFSGYGGPCPPRGHGRHHYHFKLYALDVTKLDVPATAGCREVEAAALSRALATAEFIGVYSR